MRTDRLPGVAADRGFPGRSRAALVAAALAAAFGTLQAAMLTISLHQEGNLSFQPSFPRMLGYQVATWLAWGALAPAILWLGDRFRPERPLRFLAVHLPAALAAGLAQCAAGVAAITVFRPFGGKAENPFWSRLTGRFVNSLPIELLIYCVILGAGYAVEYYRGFRDR